MKVCFVFDAQFCGYFEKTVELPDGSSTEEIEAAFEEHMGISMDNNCYYQILN